MGLDHSQLAHQLGALVVSKAQATYQFLSREDTCNYETVKMAIFYCLKITPENHRLEFRAWKVCKERRPCILMQVLKVRLKKWLPLSCYDCDVVLDQILLRQFIWDLEEDTQRWVCRHQPHNCEEAL